MRSRCTGRPSSSAARWETGLVSSTRWWGWLPRWRQRAGGGGPAGGRSHLAARRRRGDADPPGDREVTTVLAEATEAAGPDAAEAGRHAGAEIDEDAAVELAAQLGRAADNE